MERSLEYKACLSGCCCNLSEVERPPIRTPVHFLSLTQCIHLSSCLACLLKAINRHKQTCVDITEHISSLRIHFVPAGIMCRCCGIMAATCKWCMKRKQNIPAQCGQGNQSFRVCVCVYVCVWVCTKPSTNKPVVCVCVCTKLSASKAVVYMCVCVCVCVCVCMHETEYKHGLP